MGSVGIDVEPFSVGLIVSLTEDGLEFESEIGVVFVSVVDPETEGVELVVVGEDEVSGLELLVPLDLGLPPVRELNRINASRDPPIFA